MTEKLDEIAESAVESWENVHSMLRDPHRDDMLRAIRAALDEAVAEERKAMTEKLDAKTIMDRIDTTDYAGGVAVIRAALDEAVAEERKRFDDLERDYEQLRLSMLNDFTTYGESDQAVKDEREALRDIAFRYFKHKPDWNSFLDAIDAREAKSEREVLIDESGDRLRRAKR